MIEKRQIKFESAITNARKSLSVILDKLENGENIHLQRGIIWNAYSEVEYATLLIRHHLNVEDPGRLFPRKRRLDKPSSSLTTALDDLTEADENIKSQEYLDMLMSVRRAGHALREALAFLRRNQFKKTT